jgi:hypothetical protein
VRSAKENGKENGWLECEQDKFECSAQIEF